MTSREITITGFAVLAGAMVLLAVLGRLGLLSRAGTVLDALLSRRSTRLVVVLAWWWLGWHLLARTD